MRRGDSAQQTLHAQRHGNQAVAGSNDTQREGPVEPGPRRQRGPSEGEGGPRQAGTKTSKNRNKNRGTTPTVALLRAKTKSKTTNSRTLTSGKSGRGVVSSVLRLGITKTVSSPSMIVRQQRERALMQQASWREEALVQPRLSTGHHILSTSARGKHTAQFVMPRLSLTHNENNECGYRLLEV